MIGRTSLSCWFAALCIVAGLGSVPMFVPAGAQTIDPGFAGAETSRVEEGMLDWPRDDMIGALDIFIADRMAALDVPGLALAIVDEGEIVWEKGFGVGDALNGTLEGAPSGAPQITSYSLFETGGLGLPVAAYGAMMMVQDETLVLDAPLSRDLTTRWLPNDFDHLTVTLRQILTHTSGLSNFTPCCSRRTWSDPGEAFSYSGVGFMYLQHGMEEVGGLPFDRWMQTRLFGPLGMPSSGYAVPAPLVDVVVRGYVPAYFLVLAFVVPFMVLLAVFSFIAGLIVSFGFERLNLRLGDFLVPLVLATVLTPVLWFAVFGGAGVFLIMVAALLYMAAVAVGTWFVVLVFSFLGLMGPGEGVLVRGRPAHRSATLAVAVGLVVATSAFFMSFNIQIPPMAPGYVNAATSLRSNAHDLGRFMAAFIQGQGLGETLRDRMIEERVAVGEKIYWGLGIGQRRTRRGWTLWQQGSIPGYESLMVIDMDRRAGVVVLTNAHAGAALVQDIAGHVLGEEPGWELP